MGKSKPKLDLGIRKPPKERDTEAFIRSGVDATKEKKEGITSEAETEGFRAVGKGIVERADGTKKRRLVVYVQPEHGRKLKAIAALKGKDMSQLVDDLLAEWISEVDISL